MKLEEALFLPEGWFLIEKKSSFEILQKNKIPLDKEESKECHERKCVWHHGPGGKAIPAVWKGKDSSGKLWYVTNTHRAYNKAPTLKGAINRYHTFIKGTA